ncbi:MAG: lycopene beta-cyclase CrtY [Haliangium ochraceum]
MNGRGLGGAARLSAADARAAENVASHLVVGGGLAGGLIALALAEAGRGAGVVLIEQDGSLGGNHTWSFHDTDLDDDQRRLVAPLVSHRWPRHMVRFPGGDRVIEAGYASIASDDFARIVMERLSAAGVRLLLGHKVAAVGRSMVRLDDETVWRGDAVIDARGPERPTAQERTGYQKFVGMELVLRTDGPWTMPVVMDATVPQQDGYRFMYVLPFTPRRVLIEDTAYSANPVIDAEACESAVLAYAERHGAVVSGVVRRESGVLPLPLRSQRQAGATSRRPFPLAVGYRGGFFHPVTGYSLPAAARVAGVIAKARTADEVGDGVARIARELRPQRRFERFLNRLMFDAMPPEARWTALERFYRLPEDTIARFYASRNTMWDRVRLFAGRPPRGVSWRRLLRSPLEES